MWWAVGNSYWGFNFDTKGCTKAGQDAPRINCGFLGEGNFSTPWMLRMAPTYPDNLYPDEETAQRYGPPGTNASSNEVKYLTSLYWSLLMLLKSPHVGPDTLLEKLFACIMMRRRLSPRPSAPSPRTRGLERYRPPPHPPNAPHRS